MKKGITKISLLLWVLAITGFVSSTFHYHGDSHQCEEHESNNEYTDNDNLCPVCEFTHVQASTDSTSTEATIVQEDTIFSFYSLIINKYTDAFKPERAPPVIA